eukprot:437987-Ditylum_brightwellii.AAC.1
MERPVVDSSDKDHYLSAKETRKHIIENEVSFEKLKEVLPKQQTHPYERDEFNANVQVDLQQKELWRKIAIRATIDCADCGMR